MKALKKLIAAALTLALPLAALAQAPAAEQKPAEQTPAAQPATPPTAPPAKPPAAKDEVKVTPYGFIQLSAYANANTFAAKDYPAQVARTQAGGSYLMSARYSRFGVRLALDDENWTGAKLGGTIEFDFKAGHLATTSTTWYNGVMRLRLASMTATWKQPVGTFTILAGQDYGIVTPLFATSITHTADPIFWQAGNAWRRAPQIRASWAGTPEMLGLNVAAAVLSPQTNDAAPVFTPASADYGSGNASRFPSLEGRVGVNAKLDPVTVAAGVGYLYGKRRVSDVTGGTGATKDLDGTLLGVDVNVTSQWLDVKGEWFTNDGAGDTYNLIAAGAGAVATGTPPVATAAPDTVESDGFWAQAVLKPIPEVWLVGGYGREKTDAGSRTSAGQTAASVRRENEQIHAAVIFNAGKHWKFGVEGVRTTTTYADGLDQDGWQTAVSSQFVF
ncbi:MULTISPECIES: hypothetical protein [unclassified Anaeromyxobacter]|uniref:hypothetical protein n=1 Tax=unclassified Anaeromyxobacter TaxID=2620896 RepID=UPI001F5725D4|nr:MULTISPECIES: hypothetical protein [unclassified Anaeromyxobacter]